MPRCNDCNKFVGLDTDNEPEGEDVEVDTESGTAELEVRIVNACADCGSELRETTFSLTFHVEGLDEHTGEGHDIEAEATTERTSRYEGKGRGTRTFYGVESKLSVTCSCGWTGEDTARDETQASGMDEC